MSKALEMSRKTPLTSILGSQSKDEFISWTTDNNCEIHESPGRKPDWHLPFCRCGLSPPAAWNLTFFLFQRFLRTVLFRSSFNMSKKVLQNFTVRPSFPGDLFCKDFTAFSMSLISIFFSQNSLFLRRLFCWPSASFCFLLLTYFLWQHHIDVRMLWDWNCVAYSILFGH